MDEKRRRLAAAPFAVLGLGAIVAGGGIAAAVAHAPSQPLVWLVAYLVLVVGVAQCAFGVGQACLASQPRRARHVWLEWIVFNAGNAGVMLGTLTGEFALVAIGTTLFAAAMALFLRGVHRGRGGVWLLVYRVLVGVLFVSSIIGLGLSMVKHGI